MVKETTIIFVDNSDYMGYHESPRYLAQLDAMELYIHLILKPHPEHYVGVFGLAGQVASVLVEPTNDISDIMTRVCRSRRCVQGQIFLISALHLVMDLHKYMLKRMVVFIGGPLWDPNYIPGMYPNRMSATVRGREYTIIGTRLKEMGVAVDVINFGTQEEGFKKHSLCLMLAAADNNDNTRMLDRSGHHHLDASSFIALVGKGQTGLKSVLLMHGDDFQTAKIQLDKLHLKPHGGNDNTQDRKRKRDDKGHDEGRERYGDRGDRYDRKQDDRDDRRDRKQKGDDKGHDRYGRKRDYRGHDGWKQGWGC